jgi:hypothetical protein
VEIKGEIHCLAQLLVKGRDSSGMAESRRFGRLDYVRVKRVRAPVTGLFPWWA